MKAMTLGRPAKAALVAVLALIIAIIVILWAEANLSPKVTASSPAPNFQLNSPAVIVPPPTITPLRVGNVPTATPVSLAPPPAASPAPGNQHNKGHKHAGKSGKGDG